MVVVVGREVVLLELLRHVLLRELVPAGLREIAATAGVDVAGSAVGRRRRARRAKDRREHGARRSGQGTGTSTALVALLQSEGARGCTEPNSLKAKGTIFFGSVLATNAC